MRRFSSGGAIGVWLLAMLLPAIAPCLCPANLGTGNEDCCPSPSDFEAALSQDDCCAAAASLPASPAEASGTLRAPFVVITMTLTAGHEDFRITPQSPPHDTPLPGAPRPLKNLRI